MGGNLVKNSKTIKEIQRNSLYFLKSLNLDNSLCDIYISNSQNVYQIITCHKIHSVHSLTSSYLMRKIIPPVKSQVLKYVHTSPFSCSL